MSIIVINIIIIDFCVFSMWYFSKYYVVYGEDTIYKNCKNTRPQIYEWFYKNKTNVQLSKIACYLYSHKIVHHNQVPNTKNADVEDAVAC